VGAEVGERDSGLVGLHRQQHDGVVGPPDLGCRVGGRGVDVVAAVPGVQHQPPGPDRLEVRSSGHERHRVAGQGERATDDSTDGTGPVDDVPHVLDPTRKAGRVRRRAGGPHPVSDARGTGGGARGRPG
jgi:hypothetical protein